MRNAVRLAVRDRGIGVKAEDMPRVFDPYFTTKRTGSGLGLAIAKNIIEGMGGTIVLENRAGSGAEIRIELPAHEAQRAKVAVARGFTWRLEAAPFSWSTTSRKSAARWDRP